MFISFRSFNHDYHSQDYLEAVSFYIIVFKDGVLTVSSFFHLKINIRLTNKNKLFTVPISRFASPI